MNTNVMTMGERSVPAGETLALDGLLDPEKVREILEPLVSSSGKTMRSCRIGHVRYRPLTACTVSYRVEYLDHDTNDSLDGSFYAKCCSPDLYNKLKTCKNNEALTVPEWNTLFFQFPNDLKILSMRLLTKPPLLQKALAPIAERIGSNSSISPLRYKPESRLVAKCCPSESEKSPSAVLRFDRPGRSQAVFDMINKLRLVFADHAGIDFPQPLFADDQRGLSAVEIIEGSKLSDLLQGEEAPSHVRRTARTLSVLHSCTDSDLPRYHPSSHPQKAVGRANLLSFAGEEIAAQMGTISDRLKQLVGSIDGREITLVHGDFHQGQLLRSAEKDWIIDMDRSGLGDPIADLGNFVAQLTVLRLREKAPRADTLIEDFLDEYQQARQKAVSPDSLKFWIAQGLLELAAKDFRRLKPNWPVSVKTILNECQTVLDR